MKKLALDQASRITGWSIFEDGKLLTYGKFAYDDTDFGQRLYNIRNKVKSLIIDNNIDKLVFEDIQLQNSIGNNVDTYKKLAEVFGVIQELATELQIPNESIYSTVWKAGLGLKGKDRTAQKKAAQDWVINKYNLKPSQDEADAICIGQYAVQELYNPNNWTK